MFSCLPGFLTTLLHLTSFWLNSPAAHTDTFVPGYVFHNSSLAWMNIEVIVSPLDYFPFELETFESLLPQGMYSRKYGSLSWPKYRPVDDGQQLSGH